MNGKLSAGGAAAQLSNKHQKDNVSRSDIICTLQEASRFTLYLLKSVVLNGTTPQVDSEPEQSCRLATCFLIRKIGVSKRPMPAWKARLVDIGRSAGFTLIEVVIAVGLVAFVLTAILGLVAMAVNETKNADLKARLAWITEGVTSESQSQRFSTMLASLPKTNYWDYSGMQLTNDTGAYFSCVVLNVTPPPASTNFTTNNIALLQLAIRWPYPQSTSTNVSVISVFNYQ